MEASYRRHDIDDRARAIIEPLLPGQRGQRGGIAEDNRRFANAVFRVLRTGSPWRDLPPGYGDWKNTHRRFCRWRDKGVRERLLEAVVDEPDFERPMVDAGHVKARRDGTGAVGGTEGAGLAKGGSTPRSTRPRIRLACRSDSLRRKAQSRITASQSI